MEDLSIADIMYTFKIMWDFFRISENDKKKILEYFVWEFLDIDLGLGLKYLIKQSRDFLQLFASC